MEPTASAAVMERIEQFRQALGMEPRPFAEALGYGHTAYAGWMDRKAGVPESFLTGLASLSNINPAWLLSGKGEMVDGGQGPRLQTGVPAPHHRLLDEADELESLRRLVDELMRDKEDLRRDKEALRQLVEEGRKALEEARAQAKAKPAGPGSGLSPLAWHVLMTSGLWLVKTMAESNPDKAWLANLEELMSQLAEIKEEELNNPSKG